MSDIKINGNEERRWKRLSVPLSAVMKMITVGEHWHTIEGVPPGSRIVRAKYSLSRDSIELIVEHESFLDTVKWPTASGKLPILVLNKDHKKSSATT